MGIYAIKINKEEVLHENFRQQIREAIRMAITMDAAHARLNLATPNLDRMLQHINMISASALKNLVMEIARECGADGTQKLLAELQEKTGIQIK